MSDASPHVDRPSVQRARGALEDDGLRIEQEPRVEVVQNDDRRLHVQHHVAELELSARSGVFQRASQSKVDRHVSGSFRAARPAGEDERVGPSRQVEPQRVGRAKAEGSAAGQGGAGSTDPEGLQLDPPIGERRRRRLLLLETDSADGGLERVQEQTGFERIQAQCAGLQTQPSFGPTRHLGRHARDGGKIDATQSGFEVGESSRDGLSQ
jgi:hypothetical protein